MGPKVQSVACLTADPGLQVQIPPWPLSFCGDWSLNVFYGHSPLLLIQEGSRQFNTGESMCTKYWFNI